MEAVRVPPSAWSTSQSTVIWFSPSATRSQTDRSERAMSRWISWVRPDCRPRAASRSTRSGVDPGSIEYSAVTQPFPVPRIHGGTRSSSDAVHKTLVRPMVTSTDPGANSVKSRTKETGRSSSNARPSLRRARGSPRFVTAPPSSIDRPAPEPTRSPIERQSGSGLVDSPPEGLRGFERQRFSLNGRPTVRHDQLPHPGPRGHDPSLTPAQVPEVAFALFCVARLAQEQPNVVAQLLDRPVGPGI